MSRASYVGAPAAFELNQACVLINQAFGDFGCYQVGSSLERRDYRDVDVRFIMADERFAEFFPAGGNQLDPRWSLICSAISLWLSKHTGLPVDFQIQQQTAANAMFPRPARRQPLGIFVEPRT